MRLEQLVLFGPSDNFTVQFGPRVTVLTGLSDEERVGMLTTLVDAMAGCVPNASVIFLDRTGRRVFADRMGATYADTGVAAPSLSDLIGTDPEVIANLVTLRAEDLGLGLHRSQEEVEAEQTSARAAQEQVAAAHAEATGFLIELESLEQELHDLDVRIDCAPDEATRWRWIGLRSELDHLRAELAALDHQAANPTPGMVDERLLEAVEELRAAGETWAEASTVATELSQRIGPLPPVSDADLARVAATPDTLPSGLDDLIAAIAGAEDARAAGVAALDDVRRPVDDPGDGIVYQLVHLDQGPLWKLHDAAVEAQVAYETALGECTDETEPAAESAIEDAHQEVVRSDREVDRRFRPGMLGSATLAVAALLAGHQISLLLGIVMLAASVGFGWWLLVVPRRQLAVAEQAEAAALEHADADTWLGLHLRRIDHVVKPSARKGLGAALDRRSRTRLDWDEFSGGTSLDAAGERKEAIERYAAAISPTERAACEQHAIGALAETKRMLAEARRALTDSLAGYGFAADGALDLEPRQIRRVLEQRTAAGKFAREAVELQHQTAIATTSGAILDRLLRDLGFDDGGLAGRLERAIAAVEAAQARRYGAEELPPRELLVSEIERVGAEVAQGRRFSWDLTPDPTEPPVDTDALHARRRELASELAEHKRPDLASLERRVALADERVRNLEAESAALADGPRSLRRRLADRIGRTTWIGPDEENLPIVIDDALVAVEPAELFKLLDMIVRLSSKTQIVVLSGDSTVAKWARREAAHGVITLFESSGASIAR